MPGKHHVSPPVGAISRSHERIIQHLVKNGEINIEPELWRWLNSNLEREEIKRLLSMAVDRYRIPPPLASLSEQQARLAFQELRLLDGCGLLQTGRFFWRHHNYALAPRSWTYIAANQTGNEASNFFHQKLRFASDHVNFLAPEKIWADEHQRLITFNALWGLKCDRVSTAILRTTISLHQYLASQFRPSAAKALYDYFQPRRVLDFSMGWGDRLAGFCASEFTEEYFGCDPHRALHPLYAKQVALYRCKKRVTTRALPAEDCAMPSNRFDLCFTSPPYFQAERYSDDKAQSWARYADLKLWRDGFLFAALKRAHRALAPGGFMAINISDVWVKDVSEICDPMNEYLAKELKMSYCDCWGLQLNKRPGGQADKDGIFCEPIWIWRKGPPVICSAIGSQRYLKALRNWGK